ncbi:MAG: flagellar type III secretion system pore protein FliP [Planctomycetota bacterium]|jgi:flagellar biosynthetic protein FliP|nr:flagellar type III secretion system pore protein FliP [Planctomycetota bacterium]
MKPLVVLLLCLLMPLSAVEPPAMDTVSGPTADGEMVTNTNAETTIGDLVTSAGGVGSELGVDVGGVSLTLGSEGADSGLSGPIKLLLLITILAVAPGFLMMMTSFTRIIIVLGFVRRAIGTQTLPPNQVILGLSLFLTLFVMAPTIETINQEAIAPFQAEQITEKQAIDRSLGAVRAFMAKHTRKTDLALFIKIAGEERPQTIDDVSFLTLIPAFITSELKTAFQMGFIIFLPFIVIDLVIAAVLMSLGMMMLPPVIISLPFKILLFVLVDGWALLVQSLVASYA